MAEDELLSTPRFSVHRVTRPLPDGSTHQREIIRHRGCVVVIPRLEPQHVCLIRNHRVAVGETLVELPAGTLDAGESPADCAERELIEETGYRPGRLQYLTSFFAAPGILDERMHLFLATELTAGSPQREKGEEIENLVVPWDDALGMIERGEIRDAKSIVGLLFHQQFAEVNRQELGE